jgi:hypothetical protein
MEVSEAEVRQALWSEIQKAGSMRAWARRNNVSAAYVSDVIRGKRKFVEVAASRISSPDTEKK